MTTIRRFGIPLVFACALLVGPGWMRGPAVADAASYVCPPCGQPCDTKTFAAPGVCPECGMKLVPAGSAAATPVVDPDQKKVAIVVFPGVEILDYTGPYEMFGAAGCDVYLVAATQDPVTTAMGMTVVPKYTFADAPQPDVLVVPGGGVKGASEDEPTLRYIRTVTAKDRITMSVCNGAFILASAGLLDGLSATTTNGNLKNLERRYPKIKVVRDQRYVDNGKIVTAAGLSAGIDGALHVIAKLYGTGRAQSVALAEEYDWRPEGGYTRAALADQELPDIDTDSLGKWNLLRTQGDRQSWDIALAGQPKGTSAELMTQLEQALERAQWKKGATTSPTPTSRHSTWQFVGSDGKPWQGTLTMEDGEGARHEVHLELAIAQVK